MLSRGLDLTFQKFRLFGGKIEGFSKKFERIFIIFIIPLFLQHLLHVLKI